MSNLDTYKNSKYIYSKQMCLIKKNKYLLSIIHPSVNLSKKTSLKICKTLLEDFFFD